MCGECAYMIFIAYLLPVLEMERAQNLVFSDRVPTRNGSRPRSASVHLISPFPAVARDSCLIDYRVSPLTSRV